MSRHGLACLPWIHQKALSAGLSASDVNYCRNPDSNPAGPWCFVVGAEGKVFKERCDVRPCNNLGTKKHQNNVLYTIKIPLYSIQ